MPKARIERFGTISENAVGALILDRFIVSGSTTGDARIDLLGAVIDRLKAHRVFHMEQRRLARRKGAETPCACCGTPIYLSPSARAKGRGKYCSIECRGVAWQATLAARRLEAA